MFSSSPDRQPARVPDPSPIDAYRRAHRATEARPAPSAESSTERAVPQADGEP